MDSSVTTPVMENANFKKFRLLTGVVSFLLALAVFSTVVGAVPNPSYSEYADNSTVLDEDDLEEIQDIIDEDALEDIIENRKLGSIVDKDELEKVVDKEKVASELKEARLSEILDLRDLIYLIKDQKIKWLVEGDEFDDFGELFEGEDFRKIGETIDLNRFTDEELGGFIKDDKVADLLAHLTFDDLQESLGHRPIEYSDLKRILDDERLADMIERDDVEDVLKILSDEKLKNVIHEDEIDNIGDIIDEGDLDELLENEDIAEALDDNDFGSELSDSELYSILKDQKIGKIRAIIDEDDAVQFIDFEEILNFAEGSDFLQIYQIIRDEYIGDVVQVSDREDLGGIISDKDLGEILKERGFALGYDRDERINLDMRDVITDRGLSEMFEEKSLSEIEHILQNEDADDLRRLLTESKIDDSVDEEALLDFIENRDLFSVLSIIGEEDLDSVLKNDVTDKDLAKIIRKDDLEEVVSDRELGSLIKDESLGEFEDVLDDAALGRAIEDVGLANLIDDKELGGFLRDKNINDLVDDSYQDRRRYRDDYDYGDGDRNYYYGDRDRNYYYGDRDRYYYDDDRYRRDYDTNRRCSGRSIYRLQDSRRSFQSYRNRTFLREDYNPFIHGGHRNHMGREDSYYDYYNYRYDYMNSRYGSRSYRYGCRGEIGREDLTIREALGRGESRGDSGADANGDSDDAELQDIMITKVINPKIVSSGNEFLIGVRVSNRDSRSKNVDVTVDIDGERQGSKNVNIPADGRRFMNFDSEYSGPSDNVEVNITAESGDQKDKFLMDMDIATINAFIQASPETMQAGENTLISGGVEESTHASGIETRANLYVDGVRRGNVDTDTNGKFSRHLKLEDAGVHEIKVQNSDFSVSQLVNVTPVIDVENLQMPEKIFAGKEFTVCGDVIGKGIDSVEAALFVDSNISIRRTVDTSNGKIRTCFDTVFKEAEDKNIAIKAGLDKPKNGVERDIEVRHSINISSKEETVVETGNWSDLKANISNLLSRERDIKVFLVDLEEGKAKDFVKNITLDGNSMEPVVFEIKTEEVGEYSVRVEASSEGYTRSEVVRIRAETSSTITSRTVKWLEKKTGSKISSQNAIEGTQNLGLYIYNWIRNHPTLVLALLAILLLAGLLKKTRDVLVEPDTLDPYRY